MQNNCDLNDSLQLEVWIIQESLAPEQVISVTISKDVTVSDLKTFICLQLEIDPDRYELLLLQIKESSYILREFKSSHLRLEQVSGVSKVCLKFEDINWDFSKNADNDLLIKVSVGNLNYCQERIKNMLKRPKNRIVFKRLNEVKKNLSLLMAELKMDY
jgi:hypothetical protein